MPLRPSMTRLSENFTLEELTRTSTGAHNEPDWRATEKLLYLASFILEPIRERWGRVRVTSAYRSPAVNRIVGGAASSQHLSGEAADIVPVDASVEDVYRWVVEEGRLAFGQCIFERRANEWIHLSLPRAGKLNKEALVSPGQGRYLKYTGNI